MPIDQRILTCTAFVREPSSDGRFQLDGSGFFVFVGHGDMSVTYFVTAHHVVNWNWKDPVAPWPPDGSTFIRINQTKGRPQFVLETNKADWLYHPDRQNVDLCAFQVDEERHNFHDDFDVGVLNIETLSIDAVPSISQKYTLMLGDAVFITGAFSGHLGETRNIPIVRQGNIAAILDNPSENGPLGFPMYLVETRSLGGMSGSPVFFDPNTRFGRSGMGFGPARVTNSATEETSPETTIFPYRLVGMILSTWNIDDADFVSAPDPVKRPDADFNTCISVAMPVSQIVNFLQSPDVLARRG